MDQKWDSVPAYWVLLGDFMLNVLAEAVVSNVFMCQLLPCSSIAHESLLLLHHWHSNTLEQVFFVAILETESGLIQRCNYVTTDNMILANWVAFSSEWARSTQWKQLFNRQPWKTKNRSGKSRSLVNTQILRKLFCISVSQFSTCSIVLIHVVGFFWFVWLFVRTIF